MLFTFSSPSITKKMAPPSPPPSLPFLVRRSQPELICPAKATPHELKILSNIDDQEGLRFQVSFIMFYNPHPSMKGKDPVRVIREALREALVFYHPFAGRIVEGDKRKLMVDCNGEGILFIEADADISIDQLGDSMQPPCPCIEHLLYDVPGSSAIIGCPLLLIQVTRLTCGGFIFAVRINHVISDIIGLLNFLNATAEIAKGASEPSLLPIWQREFLSARNPPQVTCVHHEYEEIKAIKSNSIMAMDQPNMMHASFFFGPNEIESLRKLVPPHLQRSSTFELLTACLWKCRTMALAIDADEIVRLSPVINLRGRQGWQVPSGYYGNAFVFPAVIIKAGLLCKSPLGNVVELVKRSKAKISERYIRSMIDLMEIKGRPCYTTEWNFIVSDTSNVGLENVDFGWGKAVYGGPTGAYPNMTLFSRFRNRKGESGVVLLIWLPEPIMKRFQDELLKMIKFNGQPRIASML